MSHFQHRVEFCRVHISEWYIILCPTCDWSSIKYLFLFSFLLLFNQGQDSIKPLVFLVFFFFFSVLMRYNWQNCKIFKVHIMVIWYTTDTLWKVNLLSAVLDLFGPQSPPGPSGLAGFSFSVMPYWFSHPSRTGFPLPPRRPYRYLSIVNLKSTDIKV